MTIYDAIQFIGIGVLFVLDAFTVVLLVRFIRILKKFGGLFKL